LGLAGSGWAYSVVSKSIWLSGSKVSSFLDFEVFDLDFDDFFEGLVLVGGWGASSSSIWLSSSVMGASDTVDWVERRDDVLEILTSCQEAVQRQRTNSRLTVGSAPH
jgi:hypothetical protein